MNIVIESKKSELDSLCSRFSVKKLEVFGSSVTEQFSEESSDLDFLVEFQELSPKEHADAYFGLLLALQNLFNHNSWEIGNKLSKANSRAKIAYSLHLSFA